MNYKIYDLENHYYNREFIDYLRTRKDYPMYDKESGMRYNKYGIVCPFNARGFNSDNSLLDEVCDLDEIRLGIMDKGHVQYGVISANEGFEYLYPKEDAVKFAKKTNDAVAAAVKRHPDRFLGTFCLPTVHVEESLEELDRAVNVLGLKYWHTNSNYGSENLGDEKFEPILAKCAEYDIPFYLHPAVPSSPFLLDSGASFAMAGYGYEADTMKTAIRLIMSGVFDRYPNLRMILGHMAESFPYTLDRMDNRFGLGKGFDPSVKFKESFTYYFKNRNIMMTTSGIFDPDVMMFAIKKFGVESILFGTDYPYEDYASVTDFICSLPLSVEDRDKIFYKNAEKYILKLS